MGEQELLGSFKSLHVVGHSVNELVEKQSVQKENFQSIADKVKGLSKMMILDSQYRTCR